MRSSPSSKKTSRWSAPSCSLVCQRLPAPAAAARGGSRSRPGGRRAATRRRAPKGVANAMPSGGARAARGSRASVGGHTQSAPSAAAPRASIRLSPVALASFWPVRSGRPLPSPPLPVGKKTREPRRADDGLASRPRPCRRRLARPPRIRGLSFCARRGRHGHLERPHSQRHNRFKCRRGHALLLLLGPAPVLERRHVVTGHFTVCGQVKGPGAKSRRGEARRSLLFSEACTTAVQRARQGAAGKLARSLPGLGKALSCSPSSVAASGACLP